MPDKRPKKLTMSPEAYFRLRVMAFLSVQLALGHEMSAAVRQTAATPIPTHVEGSFRRVSERTVWRWHNAYQSAGVGNVSALEPKQRAKSEGSQVLSDALVDFFVAEKQDDPDASIPELCRRARLLGKAHPEAAIDRGTVRRALQRRGVSTGRRNAVATQDRDARRWAHPHRMQMVLADFKRFRAGPSGCKRLALYFIDDATRYVLGVRVSTDGEGVREVLLLFKRVVERYGRMSALYLDHGSGFIADALEQVAANFDPPIAVIHGEVAYPQGHGKIERYNRAVKARALRYLRKDGIDPDPDALTLRLEHDVEVYNNLDHEGIKTKPVLKWNDCTRELVPVGDECEFRRLFTVALPKTSKVTADHVISVGGVYYEVPRGYARKWVQVYRRILEQTAAADALYLDHQGAMLRLHPVDVHNNAHDKRKAPDSREGAHNTVPTTKSAAELAFNKDLRPMVASDGGYEDNKE